MKLFQRYRKDSRKSIGDSTFFEKVNQGTICWIDAPKTDFNILSVYMSTAYDFNILVVGQSAPTDFNILSFSAESYPRDLNEPNPQTILI